MSETIKDNLASVKERIQNAATRTGRNPDDITLVVVSKTFAPEIVQQAVDAGVRVLGENKVQEAVEKAPLVKGDGINWHLIGHLQSNKVRPAVKTFAWIHTIDGCELAQRLDRIAGEEGRTIDVLIQVDLAREATKSGADVSELAAIVETLDAANNLRLQGLMVLPPFFEDVEKTRPYFKRLREILDEVNRTRPEAKKLTQLSMGMSHDFEVAIEEGATLVRVGSAIFGERGK
ncbi:MAG: YggS family pyridoxal phosphate-dependent enzyme [Acidobacteriota bacterium]